MKNTKTVWFSAYRWVVPADYEAWLETLAKQGWNLQRIRQWDSIRMTFHKTEPKQYRYVFDLNAFPKKDYKATYQQFGWEFMGQMASCFIWRKEYTGERPESFTDQDSLTRRNKRVRNAVLACFLIALLGLIGRNGRTRRLSAIQGPLWVSAGFPHLPVFRLVSKLGAA